MALALLLWGCGKSAGNAVAFNPTTGAHPATWTQDHWTDYLKSANECRTCHGSTTDPAQAGGIANVSCFSCHTKGVVHYDGWALPAQHGRLGADLAPVPTMAPAVPVMAGFAHCTKCHGSNYDGGISAVSCRSCHATAPHPAKPWFDATGTKPSHALVNPGNLGECVKCHAAGANSLLKPAVPAPAGTAPGCYNATLCHSTGAHTATWVKDHWAEYLKTPNECRTCHGSTTDPAQAGGVAKVSCFSCHTTGVDHPTGWALAAQHGQLAQAAPVTTVAPAIPVMAGFAHCAKCHGSNYGGGLSGSSCMTCHTKAPHPNKPWLPDSGVSLLAGHPSTNTANLPECVACHAHGANSSLVPPNPAPAGTAPGCSNATLCHG